MRKGYGLVLSVFAMSVAAACTPQSVPGNTPTLPTHTITLYATPAAALTLHDLVATYAQTNPTVEFIVVTGDYGSLFALLETVGTVVFTNHLPPGQTPWAAPVATDGIAIITHPDVGIDDLDLDELRLVFQGFVTNWSTLGGQDTPVQVVSRTEESGTLQELKRLLMGNRPITPNALVVPSAQAAVEMVQRTEGAIAAVSASLAPAGVTVLSIDGAAPTAEHLASYRYPLRSTLYAVSASEPDPLIRDFIAWAQSRHQTGTPEPEP
jgi:hypothetical protein